MKRFFSAILCLILAFQYSIAQTPSTYKPLECRGKLPSELTTPSSEKYKKEIATLNKKAEGRKTVKHKKQFSLETHFTLDKLMRSGLVIFNDEVSDYLNRIGQVILANESEVLRKKVKIYLLRSTAVNAFATERGNIFVTLGLVSKIKNEAQLAFILAHEIAHVKENHNIDMFLETKKYSKKTVSDKELGDESIFDHKQLKKCLYSKELETEADSLGTLMMQKTAYNLKNMVDVFHVLKFSSLPFSDEDFDYGIFEGATYQLPSAYKDYAVVNPEGEDEHEDDTKHSHPNIGSRKAAVSRILARGDLKAGEDEFLVSKETFNKVQKIAQYEMPKANLHQGDLAQAIYTAGDLMRKDPNNLYLRKAMAQALYLHAKYTNDSDYKYHDNTENVEGASQSVYHFLDTMTQNEINALALRYVWKTSLDFPKDSELSVMKKDMVYEFNKYVGGCEELKVTEKKIEVDSMKSDTASAQKRARRNKSGGVSDGSVEYWKLAMKDFEGEALDAAFVAAKKEKAEREEEANAVVDSRRNRRKKGLYLGIDKIVVVNPSFLYINQKKEAQMEHLKSEDGQKDVKGYLDVAAKAAKLKMEILDVNALKSDDVDKFNDIRNVNDWFSQQHDYDNLSLTPGLSQAAVDSIAQKYGTKYFMWMGVLSLQNKKPIPLIVTSCIFVPPLGLYLALKPSNEMLYYSILYDVTTGRRDVVGLQYCNRKENGTRLKAFFFDSLNQIKKTRK